MLRNAKKESIVVTALQARSSLGALLHRIEKEHRSLVIQKRGMPKAVLLSIRDYVRLAAPEPEVLRIIGEESGRKGTDKLTSQQIDRIIQSKTFPAHQKQGAYHHSLAFPRYIARSR
jgi:prevent-host-death family protein